MRIYQICFTILLFCFPLLEGCTYEENIEIEEVKKQQKVKDDTSPLKGNYGNNEELIKKAMLKIDRNISAIEEVQVIEEDSIKGVYIFSDYKIISSLDMSEGIEKAKLILDVQKNNLVKQKNQYEFDVKLADVTAPQITLKEDFITIHESDEIDFNNYIEKVKDDLDGELSIAEIINPIPDENDKWQCGEYEVRYVAKDTHENESEKVLKVKVISDLEDKALLSEPVLSNLANTDMNNLALSLLGKPYVWGGKGPDVFDCSGVIMYIYQCLGMELSWAQVQYGLGTSISLDEANWKIGDVLSFSDNSGEIVHHALYLGNRMALHATTNGVCILSIDAQMESGPQNPQRLVRVCRYI